MSNCRVFFAYYCGSNTPLFMPDTQNVMNTIDTHSRDTIGIWAFILIIWETLVLDSVMTGWYLLGATVWTLFWTAGVPLMIWAEWKDGINFGLDLVSTLFGLTGTTFTTYLLYDKAKRLWRKNHPKTRNKRK